MVSVSICDSADCMHGVRLIGCYYLLRMWGSRIWLCQDGIEQSHLIMQARQLLANWKRHKVATRAKELPNLQSRLG